MASNGNYKKAAIAKFAELKPTFAAGTNYWQLGHSFDTIVDYFVNVNPDDAKGFAQTALGRYSATKPTWYDDYGWWGVAALKASQHPDLLGPPGAFQKPALDCWGVMTKLALTVWQRYGRQYPDYGPRFTGGAWNFDWSASNPKNPTNTLEGIQNTVTNVLYLLLSTRLAEQQSPYRTYADDEFKFLKQWLDLASDAERLLAPDTGLVRERVSTYASGLPVAGYQESWYWTGDQGLVVGGLVDRMRLVGTRSPDYQYALDTARTVLAAVLNNLVDPDDGTLSAWLGSDVPRGDTDDYGTGPGVFMRYLLYAYQQSTDLRADVMACLDVVEKTAVTPSIVSNELVNQTNDLAALVTAYEMTKPGAAAG
jgi:hypothetical protein